LHGIFLSVYSHWGFPACHRSQERIQDAVRSWHLVVICMDDKSDFAVAATTAITLQNGWAKRIITSRKSCPCKNKGIVQGDMLLKLDIWLAFKSYYIKVWGKSEP